MKKLLIALLLPLAACSSLGAVLPTGETAVAASNTVLIDGTKALAVAADAYAGVASTVAVAVRGGHFNSTQLAMIRTLNDQAIQLLKGGDSTLSVAQRAAGVMIIITQLHSILGG